MLGENIKTLRKQKGYSQETLAEQLNVVRQTISKWEKNLSVPDAEMLERMANLFEVPVTKLLGSETPEDEKEVADISEVVKQLAILNEQLAKQSRNRKRLWKIVLGAVATWIVLIMFLFTVAIFFRASNAPVGNITTTHMHCTLNGTNYTYGITYDEQYRILEAGGDAWIADHVEAESCGDANILIARIENLMNQWGGTCSRVDVQNGGIDSNGGNTQYYEDCTSAIHHEENTVTEHHEENTVIEHHREKEIEHHQEH